MLRAGQPEDRAKLMMSVGTHRRNRPLTPLECAEKIENELRNGNNITAVAAALHVSPSMLGKFRKLLDLSPRIQNIVDWERTGQTISMSVGSEIARLRTEEEQNAVGELVLTHKLAKAEVQHLINLKNRQGMALDDGMKIVLDARPQVVDVYAFFGAIIDVGMQDQLSELIQTERDVLFRKCLISIFGPDCDPRGRLGSRQYSIVGNSDLPALVRELPEGLDIKIDQELKQQIYDN